MARAGLFFVTVLFVSMDLVCFYGEERLTNEQQWDINQLMRWRASPFTREEGAGPPDYGHHGNYGR